MATIATISSSRSEISRTDAVLSYVTKHVVSHGHRITPIVLRDLPAEPLLRGRADDPAVAAAIEALDAADGVVVTTPVYQAAYAGLLKVFLDLLPRSALRGKTVLPLATGGSLAHVLVIDYAPAARPDEPWRRRDRSGLLRALVTYPLLRRGRTAPGCGSRGAALPSDRGISVHGGELSATFACGPVTPGEA